jgi:hypothetical protein
MGGTTLKKLAAVALLAGLVLHHSCGVSPLIGVWQGLATTIMFGIPVLATIAYALHQLLPALARFHERHGPALHGLFRAVCLVLLGVYVGAALDDDAEQRARIATAVTFAITIGLLVWQQSRATKAQRLPLLLLTIVGVGAIDAFVNYVGEGMQYGGWVFTAGWLLAVGTEATGLRGTPPVSHGG